MVAVHLLPFSTPCSPCSRIKPFTGPKFYSTGLENTSFPYAQTSTRRIKYNFAMIRNTATLTSLLALTTLIFLMGFAPLQAQTSDENIPLEQSELSEDSSVEPELQKATDPQVDAKIQQRIRTIFSQIGELKGVVVDVREGVVKLSGNVANEAQAARAVELADRVEGVFTVDDGINRTLDVEGNVKPVVEAFQNDVRRWTRATPLLLLALFVFILIAYIGHRFAGLNRFWRRVAPNPFLAELISQAVRITAIVIGLVVALNLLGANKLVGTILGGAGVLSLAIGFAVRDSLENYISSIMLSLRQPFRSNDHVVINTHEGKVVRLTSRATVLMTLDGNHLRIPNSTVFKAVILNYTTNPERRFEFELGVDGNDDPIAAIQTGINAMKALDFVLQQPKCNGVIKVVGDSNIVIRFTGWVNQTETDFGKARSAALFAAKLALEKHGFSLPEPIYRVRFDESLPAGLTVSAETAMTGSKAESAAKPEKHIATSEDVNEVDVAPETHLDEKVSEERAAGGDADLLDKSRPVE